MVGYPNDVLFAPTGTTLNEAAALTAAMRSALAQSGAKSAELSDGLSTGYINPTTALRDIHNEVKYQSAILPYLTSTRGSRQTCDWGSRASVIGPPFGANAGSSVNSDKRNKGK